MNSIMNDLQYALQRKALVNVYQVKQDVVYTGYVDIVDDAGIILTTFDDTGSEDGAVYLTFEVIELVEFESDDLDNMRFRIENATAEHFFTFGRMTTEFNLKRPLIRQVLATAMADETAIMVLDKQSGELHEGEVTRIAEQDFDLQIFNKFDLSQHPLLTFKHQDVALIEFEGKELTLQTAAMGYLQTLTPVKKMSVTRLTEIAAVLHQAEQTQQLISINPVADEGMFFVGRVNTIGENSVVINLIDMTGQFGGYWLVRLTAIAQVTTQSDYLAVMKTYMTLDQTLGVVAQPELNDERLFDGTDNLFQAVLSQASKFHRVIRLQLNGDDNVVGYISKFGGNEIIFHLVEQGTVIDTMGTLIELSDIDEVAFDYLDAMLTEKQLRNQGEL
ncbi:hypothetical protein [Secundilactobacillus silagei]|uniref:Uncharacterized protein n=1 Tax=Secundilactobacillus silagei JCM 19001 TaxID=1302250 RepID=A0A1Z5H3I5_9LACO|nr:hypothetical protein [Secundilactobacillus silagei]TDG70370.1 hypothetical protein C5L25_001560 [Secundilactobacillus silagei JCM 19001]GAT17858.1 hypothetical protein IWT126_00115 [Secundilactobacillus silagei JCM 19001]